MGLEEGATWNYRDNTILQNINFKLDGTSEVKQESPSRGFKIIDDEWDKWEEDKVYSTLHWDGFQKL